MDLAYVAAARLDGFWEIGLKSWDMAAGALMIQEAGGTVSDFSLWIEGKKTPGAVLEKDEARRIYESIVRRVRDPGLVEYIDGKLFRASIFPIPPRGTQKLEILVLRKTTKKQKTI